MTRIVAPYVYAPFAPDPADILAGLATSNSGTIITIPAGRTWSGTVTLSASVLVTTAGAAVNASARVSTAGTGVVPTAGDYVRLDIAAPISATALNGTSGVGSVSAPLLVSAPVGNSVTLVLNATNTTVQSASASGVLL